MLIKNYQNDEKKIDAAELIIPIKNLLKNDERRKSCSCINNANKELA
jgi:hypothetical protein